MLDFILSQLNWTSVVIFLLVFLLAYYWLTRPRNMPPGPTPLPFVGNMYTIMRAVTEGSDILSLLRDWHKQYGDVFTVRMGSKNLVVINNYDMVHDLFVKQGDVSSGRPAQLYTINKVVELTGMGVIFSDGPKWKELRRVTLMTMRDFGVGKKTLEQRVQDEARAIVDVIDQGQGQGQGGKGQGYSFHAKPLFSKFASNVICSIIFGNRFEYSDPKFIELTRLITRTLSQPVLFNPANFVSIARFIPFVNKMHHTIFDSFARVDKYLSEILKEHEETYDEHDIRDFVDLYIKTRSESKDAHLYNASNMRRVIIDLFFAGTETSASTGEWLVIYMAAYPDIQKRCQQEVDKVVGPDRPVSVDDRKSLPYINAVIHEILRFVSIAPMGFPHVMTRDVKIGGYDVPAGTMVMPYLREMHRDLDLWSDANTFRPDRFLDKDGQFSTPKHGFAPFSMGPRTCLGEVLARMELFILFSTLVQFFNFNFPEGHKPDLDGNVGITFSAKPQDVIATRR